MRRQSSASPAQRKQTAMKAQSAGKAFESAFESICAQNNFTCIRIPNGCRSIPMRPFIVRTKSPFDFVISHKGFTVFLDLKSSQKEKFPYADCDPAQIKTLYYARKDNVSGYLIHFTSLNKIVFFDSIMLKNLKPRESLHPDSGELLGDFGYQCDLHRLKNISPD